MIGSADVTAELVMKYVEKMGGKVSYVRLRSQRVVTSNRRGFGRSFAIERDTAVPALQASDGAFVFSEHGVGIYPVAIYADTLDLVLQALRESTACFRIEQKGELKSSGFSICARVTDFSEMPVLEIFDADKQIIKDTWRMARGVLPGVGPHGNLAHQLVNTVRSALNAPLSVNNALTRDGKVAKAFPTGGKKVGVGVIVHMMHADGFTSTGRTAVPLAEIATLLDPSDYGRRVRGLLQALDA